MPSPGYFYPRPPRGGRQLLPFFLLLSAKISIHVPREGDDLSRLCGFFICRISIHVPREGDDGDFVNDRVFRRIFLSTSPARGTTDVRKNIGDWEDISIHVPREGDDSKCDGKYIAFSCNICHNKIQRTKTRCIFVQNATVSAAYLHKYPKNDNRPPVRTVRCFSAHCRLAPAPCRPQRAFLHRCLYTSKISSCAHCGARPTCSTLVLYWLPSR